MAAVIRSGCTIDIHLVRQAGACRAGQGFGRTAVLGL